MRGRGRNRRSIKKKQKKRNEERNERVLGLLRTVGSLSFLLGFSLLSFILIFFKVAKPYCSHFLINEFFFLFGDHVSFFT